MTLDDARAVQPRFVQSGGGDGDGLFSVQRFGGRRAGDESQRDLDERIDEFGRGPARVELDLDPAVIRDTGDDARWRSGTG